ncbi:MAG TPA: FtsX-like permease family protein [Acidimicrobiales bacterium]
MFTLTIKELAARKLRLLATAFAVVLGVAFMAGTLVLGDTLDATFDNALAEANAGVDAYVRVPSPIALGYGTPGPRFEASTADAVALVDGVDRVVPRINGYAQLVGPDGQPVGDMSESPAFGTNWVTFNDLNPYVLASGHAPTRDDEIVVDKASADKAGYRPGDVATVLTKREPRQFTIAGTARFGTADSPAGATAVLFTDAAAAELLAEPGQVDALVVTADAGVTQEELADAVQSAVGTDLQVITGAALVAEDQAALDEVRGPFATIMLVFGFVGVFVGAFIINNAFSITVAQRTRQLAMLRAIGASSRQVRRVVLLEALVIGALASAVGLLAGIGVAAGLRQMIEGMGFDLPDGAMVIERGVLILSFAVGVMVTTLSAWLPARRAARIAPIEALRDVSLDRSAGSVRRVVTGTLVVAAGVATLLAGLGGNVALVGIGALATFIGVAILGPTLARPVAWLFGIPLRLRGLRGELATRNAMRNPKRTARTASSLMIGVALVGFMTVFAASAKTSLAGSLATDFTGTHIVDSGAWSSAAGLSPELALRLRGTPGVDVVTTSRMSPAIVDGSAMDELYAFDSASVGRVFRLGSIEGDVHRLGADGIAVSADKAAAKGWSVGSQVPVTFPGGDTTLVVKAIYTGATDWVGSLFVDIDALRANGGGDLDYRVYLVGEEDAVNSVAADYPSAHVLDKQGFLDLVSGEIDAVLGLFYAMLMLAIVIALLGIANSLALSVFERTRELGLLRAVGMHRSQVRSTVRWEAIVIAVFGATLGLAVGTFFGWATVRAMADDGINTLTVPVGSLAVITVLAAGAGALAAALPARRAAKLDVLQALVTT